VSSPLGARLHEALLSRGETVAVAESLTAGLIAAALTETAGTSSTFRGGLVVYATDLKTRLAGVPKSLLDRYGPVSRPVAAALAAGVAERLGADFGLSSTGVAGPTTQGGAPVGTVFVGLTGPAELSRAEPEVLELRLSGDRAAIRRQTVNAALELLASVLKVESA
jgi:nicotinamide-nucleotide amidase